MSTRIELDLEGDWAEITLVPPSGSKPTLDHAVLDEIDHALDDVLASRARLLLLRSATPKHFCLGASVGALSVLAPDTVPAWIEHGHRVLNRLEAIDLLTLALVEGYCLDGGLEIAMACDVILATPDARFGLTRTRLGVATYWGGAARLARRVGDSMAKVIAMGGRVVDGGEAHRLGLATVLDSLEGLQEWVEHLGEDLGASSEFAGAEAKRLIAMGSAPSSPEYMRAERGAAVRCLGRRDTRRRIQDLLDQQPVRLSPTGMPREDGSGSAEPAPAEPKPDPAPGLDVPVRKLKF